MNAHFALLLVASFALVASCDRHSWTPPPVRTSAELKRCPYGHEELEDLRDRASGVSVLAPTCKRCGFTFEHRLQRWSRYHVDPSSFEPEIESRLVEIVMPGETARRYFQSFSGTKIQEYGVILSLRADDANVDRSIAHFIKTMHWRPHVRVESDSGKKSYIDTIWDSGDYEMRLTRSVEPYADGTVAFILVITRQCDITRTANKSLQPTATAVMPRARARVTPAVAVAEH